MLKGVRKRKGKLKRKKKKKKKVESLILSITKINILRILSIRIKLVALQLNADTILVPLFTMCCN